MDSISSRIQQALTIRNMTQSDIVKHTGISKGSISQYVSGHVEPKQDRIYLIAKALNVREAWLIGYDVPMDRTDSLNDNFTIDAPEDMKFMEKFRKLSDIDRQMIEQMVERMLSK